MTRYTSASKLVRTTALLSTILSLACQSSPSPDAATSASSATSVPAPPELPVPAATTAAVEGATTPAANATTAEPKLDATPAQAPDDGKAGTVKPVTDAKPSKPASDPSPAATTPPKVDEPPKDEPAAIEKPCLAKTFEFASVRKACEKGGVPKAKALMKSWTNKAKDKGESFKCTTCHDNQKTYSNKANASADLRKLLDVIK